MQHPSTIVGSIPGILGENVQKCPLFGTELEPQLRPGPDQSQSFGTTVAPHMGLEKPRLTCHRRKVLGPLRWVGGGWSEKSFSTKPLSGPHPKYPFHPTAHSMGRAICSHDLCVQMPGKNDDLCIIPPPQWGPFRVFWVKMCKNAHFLVPNRSHSSGLDPTKGNLLVPQMPHAWV